MFHITYGQYNHNIYTPHIKTTDIATHAAMFTISRGTYCTISMVMKCRYCALVDIVEPTHKKLAMDSGEMNPKRNFDDETTHGCRKQI